MTQNKYIGLPKTIKVGAKLYKTKMTPGLRGIEDTLCYAIHNPITQTMTFDVDSDKDAVGHVIHESLHALLDQHDNLINVKQEERVVKSIAHGLSTLFMDNPGLLRWIQRRSKYSFTDEGHE